MIGSHTAYGVTAIGDDLARLGLLERFPVGASITETLVVRTSRSWEVSTDAEHWTPAMRYSAFGPYPGIWDATPDQAHEALFFRENFVVPGAIRGVHVEGGSDDDLLFLEINGTRIFGESSGSADLLLRDTTIATVAVVEGENVVFAHARNMYGHSAFGAQITVDFEAPQVLAWALAAVRRDRGLISENAEPGQQTTGTSRADLLSGGDGADWIIGGNGVDVLLGSGGADRLEGGAGSDLIHGGVGADLIYASSAETFGTAADTEVLLGGGGGDTMFGGAGADVIDGGDGRDLLIGYFGADVIDGGSGDDRVSGGGGDDIIRLGDGDDFVFHDATLRHDYGRGADLVIGEGGDDRLHGGRGDDVVDGGDGNDTLNGGPGNDRLIGGSGQDTFEFRGSYGIDRIEDFSAGDRLAVGRAINALGEITAEMLVARLSLDEVGTRLDLGGANAVVFAGLEVEETQGLILAGFELI